MKKLPGVFDLLSKRGQNESARAALAIAALLCCWGLGAAQAQNTGALDAGYVRVPRVGAESRFLPIKDHAELARRAPDLRGVLEARGILAKGA